MISNRYLLLMFIAKNFVQHKMHKFSIGPHNVQNESEIREIATWNHVKSHLGK